MRVAIVAESFLPAVNGVTNSVLRILEHLRAEGHQALVIAPSSGGQAPSEYAGFPVLPALSAGFPGYPDLSVGMMPSFRIEAALRSFRPDVLHVAAPIQMGWKAIQVADRMLIPSVAVYQTEYADFAGRYGFSAAQNIIWRRVRNAHSLATLSLAPSSYARQQLVNQGIPRVSLWGRGVDATRFDPVRRDQQLHDQLGGGRRIVGYVGRLAAEKQVEDLAAVADLPEVQLVIVGDGPARASLAAKLPQAIFLGQLTGDDLPRVLASMDVFVHTGEMETFCQAIQEALASGVPAIAPARGGPIDLIDPSHTGWLYRPGDLAAMRSHVIDLVRDDRKRQAFSLSARAAVVDRSWHRICEQLLGHYRSAIQLERSEQIA